MTRRDKVDVPTAQNFIRNFIAAYQAHGGVVMNKAPPIIGGINDAAAAVESVFNAAGNQCLSSHHQLLVRS